MPRIARRGCGQICGTTGSTRDRSASCASCTRLTCTASVGVGGTTTTQRGAEETAATVLGQRVFTASALNQLWVADITYVPTWAGFLYVAAVLDALSRRIVGWARASHLKTRLDLDALEMAHAQRHPAAVIHHSDHGCQYTALAFGQRCTELGVPPSRGSVGDCYDNAMGESFFATLEC